MLLEGGFLHKYFEVSVFQLMKVILNQNQTGNAYILTIYQIDTAGYKKQIGGIHKYPTIVTGNTYGSKGIVEVMILNAGIYLEMI